MTPARQVPDGVGVLTNNRAIECNNYSWGMIGQDAFGKLTNTIPIAIEPGMMV